jgi:hypothetical protein
MLDMSRAALWHYGRALELNGYNSLALWFYARAYWLPW